jgi:hypothetical protein
MMLSYSYQYYRTAHLSVYVPLVLGSFFGFFWQIIRDEILTRSGSAPSPSGFGVDLIVLAFVANLSQID